MNKEQIIEKLKELGIVSTNCYPKSSFIKNEEPSIGLYKSEYETLEPFYFYNTFDKKIYVRNPVNRGYPHEEFKGVNKYIIPLEHCQVIWEDKPFEELVDTPYKDMTLRHYACIQLKVPESGLPWLDVLIKHS